MLNRSRVYLGAPWLDTQVMAVWPGRDRSLGLVAERVLTPRDVKFISTA